MKIGIVTLFGYSNYGNRLQNYAIQIILEKKGYDVDTLVCIKKPIKEKLKSCVYECFALFNFSNTKRRYLFKKFCDNHMNIRFIKTKNGLIPKNISFDYDYFITGSDQVWNPIIRKKEKYNFFLRFANPEQRIALSPSIANPDIPKSCFSEYVIGLNGFQYLSCREHNGSRLIEEITKRECETIIDPTLFIKASEWRKLAGYEKIKKNYILLLFLGDVNDELKEKIISYAKINEMEIVDLFSKKDSSFNSDPLNFVRLIDNASLVLTDSFHGTAFSINLNTPFYVFDRKENIYEANHMSSRISSLIDTFKLTERYCKSIKVNWTDECDFSISNSILENERQKFEAYLDRCLSQKELPYSYLPDTRCTGCSTCKNICPMKCIDMVKNEEGFFQPIVSEEKCIKCGLCKKMCPVLAGKKAQNDILKIYGAYQKEKESLLKSSSGAIFPLLCEYVMDNKGVVFGAAFDNEFNVKHILVDNKKDLNRLYTSKYVQSDVGDTFKLVKQKLDNGILVLYSGTPCQIVGLQHYLGKKHTNLILVDFICHGVPSPKVWKKYREEISHQKLKNEPILYVNFRDKKDGWENFSLRILSKSYEYVSHKNDDPYLKGFLNNVFLMQSCHNCSFKGVERISDITLADFWGGKQIWEDGYNPDGMSMILIHSKKGIDIWSKLEDKIISKELDFKDVVGKVNSAMMKSSKAHPSRTTFFNKLNSMNIVDNLKENSYIIKKSFFVRVKRKLIGR